VIAGIVRIQLDTMQFLFVFCSSFCCCYIQCGSKSKPLPNDQKSY